jgi:hypothetical protein
MSDTKHSLFQLDAPAKWLSTSLVAVLGAGFLVSELYIVTTIAPADGRPGVSLDDVTFTYHGDRTMSVLKAKAQGTMKRYFSAAEDPRRLTPEEQADLERLAAWSETGAPEVDFWDPAARRKKPGPILLLLERHSCLDCHSPLSTTIGNKKDSPLTTYADVARYAQPGTGMATRRLLALSHIHLLGIGLIFLLTGAAVSRTRFSQRLRAGLVVAGPASVLMSIGGWWAVKYGGALFSPLVVLGGLAMLVAFACSATAVLVDLWRKPV